jgi:uncharacterized protein (TIGR00251 family)
VQPRASQDAILGLRDGVVRVRLTAPPVDGKANQALCRLLARALGVAPSAVAILRGDAGRDKLVRIAGIDAAALGRLASRDRGPR